MPLKTQSESSKTKKKSAVPVKISIESLRHDLNLPEFWIKNPWQKWCVQNYDIEAIKINPGIKRAFAHQNLTNDIKTILNAYKNKSTGREYERIKQIKSDLKNIHKNRTNNYFWREQAVKESKLATENEILEKRKEIARKTYEVATIKNLAKELDSVKSKKRNHDDIDKEQMQAKNKRPTYASSISRSEEEENDDEEEEEEENEEDNEEEKEEENEEDDDDKSTDLLNQGIQEQDDNDEADNSVKENQVGTSGRDVCEVVNDNGDIDTFEARQELFAWAFNLINKEPHAKNDKMIEQLRRKTKTKIDHLNLLSLCLLDGWPINNEVLENLLRISLSGIIDLSHDWTATYTKNIFQKSTWDEMKTLTSPIIQLEDGCDEVFDTTVAILKGKYAIEDGGVKYLNKEHHALIYLTERKLVEMKSAIDSPILQIIDILESIIKNCLHRSEGNESELDCMEDCYTIMKIVLRGPQYKFQLGEQACVESKAVRERNEKDYSKGGVFSTTHNIMGRKVDLLVASHDQNISSCEWKADNVTPSTIRKQECKNVRTNACILESLLKLPFDPEDFDPKSFHIMYMDWVGHDGALNIIKKDEDVFVVNKLGDMFIPVTIYDINAKFKKAIQLLYTWKNNLDEVIKLLPAAQAEKLRQDKKAKRSLFDHQEERPPLIFFTPKNNRTHAVFDIEGEDCENYSNDDNTG